MHTENISHRLSTVQRVNSLKERPES